MSKPKPTSSAPGATIRELREAQGVTVTELAKRVGWDKARLSRLETGQRGLLAEDFQRLIDALHIKWQKEDDDGEGLENLPQRMAEKTAEKLARWQLIAKAAGNPGRRMSGKFPPIGVKKADLPAEDLTREEPEVIVDWTARDAVDGGTYIAKFQGGEWTIRGRVVAIGKRL